MALIFLVTIRKRKSRVSLTTACVTVVLRGPSAILWTKVTLTPSPLTGKCCKQVRSEQFALKLLTDIPTFSVRSARKSVTAREAPLTKESLASLTLSYRGLT